MSRALLGVRTVTPFFIYRHTSTFLPGQFSYSENWESPYLPKLMIVRIIVATIPGPCVSPLGDGAPLVGILPAKAVPERTHARAAAIMKRFMGGSPLKLRMQEF